VTCEARDRIGGRVHTDMSFDMPIDFGASIAVSPPDHHPLGINHQDYGEVTLCLSKTHDGPHQGSK